jgi:hypothetical protein
MRPCFRNARYASMKRGLLNPDITEMNSEMIEGTAAVVAGTTAGAAVVAEAGAAVVAEAGAAVVAAEAAEGTLAIAISSLSRLR